jgi:pimeloyl-ACP methyl ester carboxylesterase
MTRPKPIRGHAPLNGQRIHYEMHGAGEPLLLIHGEFGMIADFGAALPELSRGRQAIVVDLQGHGRTADIDRPLCFELLADDIAALIRHLGFEYADIAGFSLGGCVALQTAIRNPRAVGRLVVVSAPCRSDGWDPAARTAMERSEGRAMAGGQAHAAYEEVAPNPDRWPALVAKTKTLLTFPFDWTAELSRIQAPTLVVTGEHDAIVQGHADELAARLAQVRGMARDKPGARRVVLPGVTHQTILASPGFAGAVVRFLEEPIKTNRW